MKTTILVFVISISFNFLSAQNYGSSGFSSGHNPHDSLLFDGANEITNHKFSHGGCGWKVKHVWGHVVGTKDTAIKLPLECGDLKNEGIETYNKKIRSAMKDGDIVDDNDSLTMGDNSLIQIEINIRPEENNFLLTPLILTVQCRKFIVPSCGYEQYFKGDPYVKVLFDSYTSKPYSISTDRCIIKNNGTKYTVETKENEDIIKVYDGSVDVMPKKYESTSTQESQRLIKDFQNGKISMDEFIKKSKELNEKIMKETNNYTMKVVVEAGQQVIVGKILGEVTPISADDDKWWDNENFK